MVSTAESKHHEAATIGHCAELLSRGHFTTTESFSMPSKHTCTPAFHIHNWHRHCESRDLVMTVKDYAQVLESGNATMGCPCGCAHLSLQLCSDRQELSWKAISVA